MPPPSRSTTSRSHDSFFEPTTLFEFSKVVNSSLDVHFVLSHALLTIMGKTLSTRGMALLKNERGAFRIETVKGFSSGLLGREVPLRGVPRGACEIDRPTSTRGPWARFFKEQKVNFLLPLCIGERPIGILAFGGRLAKTRLRRKELTYLRSLANLSATAIQKTRTIGELQLVNRRLDRKIQELKTLFELGREFDSLLESDRLIRLLVFSLMGQIGVSRYMICLKRGQKFQVVASRIDGPAPRGELLALLTRQKGPSMIADLPVKGKTDPRDVLAAIGLTVIVPMQMQGETRGLILLGEKLNRETFSADDLEFLSSLANLAIISLENARLFKETIEKQKLEDELLLAREIQKGLLPATLPRIPGFDLAATNISSTQVGGDYYDVISIDGDRHVIAIGDVSGKGYPAALLMANLQATIRALVPLRRSLGELTGQVNDLMCENTGGTKFVTFFWGILDHGAGVLTYVNAGHNYPYVVRADGRMERMNRGGMILGVIKTAIPYEEAVVQLRVGDTIVLFTDGVSEAMNRSSVEYGEERLEAVFAANGGRGASAMMDAIQRDVLRHTSGAPQSDDLTMMIVRMTG